MALKIPAGFGQLAVYLRLNSDPEPMAIVFGVAIGDDIPTNAELQAFVTAIATILKVNTSTEYVFTGGKLTIGPSGPGVPPLAVVEVAINIPGTNNVQVVPQNTATLVRKLGGGGGRRNKGRFYFPSVFEQSVDGRGVYSGGAQADMQTMMNAFMAYLIGNPISDESGAPVAGMYLLHSTTPAIPNPDDLPDPTPISGLAVQPQVATQRRRLRP